MQYFYLSIFYDKAANNEKTKEDLSRLKSMKGLEYLVVHSMPELGIFHIRKQYRTGERRVTPIALYYVYGGMIYEAPSLGKLLKNRVRNIALFLHKSQEICNTIPQ